MTLAADGLFNAKAFKYTYADETTREAATGFVPADIGSLALQLDDNTLWMLTDDSPETWVPVGGTVVNAAAVAFTPAGTIAATNVQDAIEEVAAEGGDLVVVDDVILSGDQTDVLFPASGSLPTDYADLELVIMGRCTNVAGSALVAIQCNGDTGSNYAHKSILGGQTAGVSAQAGGGSNGQTMANIGVLPAANATAGYAGTLRALIGNYQDTTFHKAIVGNSADFETTTTGYFLGYVGEWHNTAAITSIRIKGAFKAGTRLTLYGRKGLASPRTT